MIDLDQEELQARIFFGLKALYSRGDTLPPRYLEHAICKSFAMEHVGDGNFYADGIADQVQASIKTRAQTPHVLKTKAGRDFQSHPDLFLGPHQNVKQQKWTGGLEIVQRRQALDFDDVKAAAARVGRHTLQGFQANVQQSYERYGTSRSVEIVGVHGYNSTLDRYLVSLFWQEYQPLDADNITWVREGSGVSGYQKVGRDLHKVVERVNGNAKREATCFKEYKNVVKYQQSCKIAMPLPEPWAFDRDKILAEINDLRNTHANPLLFE